MRRKRLVILGSTGSIGINTLRVVERFPEEFQVIGLTACSNYKLLEKQIERFAPPYVAVGDEGVKYFQGRAGTGKTKVWDVAAALEDIVRIASVDMVVIAMGGSAALRPFRAAVRAGKKIATANKEALVVAGDILRKEAQKYRSQIIPIDSEQSAIFQCLEGRRNNAVRRIYLTASGGALWNVPSSQFHRLRVRQILNHPRWKMGKRITVDSATLMNKGFEVIEAKCLFGVGVEDIEVVVHPQAIIHSMVEFQDGAVMAQLGVTDMRLPIQYALTYPRRLDTGLEGIDFFKLRELTFEKPDLKKFPALELAMEAAREGGTLPCALNAADEEAVEAFLTGRIGFTAIYPVVERVVRKHKVVRHPSLADIEETDVWARAQARQMMNHSR